METNEIKLVKVYSSQTGELVREVEADVIEDNGKLIFLYLDGKRMGFFQKSKYRLEVE